MKLTNFNTQLKEQIKEFCSYDKRIKNIESQIRNKYIGDFNMIEFLENWLEDREAQAIVDVKASRWELRANSVCQSAVLGPPLWNLLF